MTSYLSDSYVNDSQEIPRPPVMPGPFEVPTMMVVGEITYPDGYRVLVPQPSRDAWLSFTGVMDAFEKAPQSHAEARSARPPMPVWPVALIVAGLALMAFGWLLNEPVSRLIYTLIHRS